MTNYDEYEFPLLDVKFEECDDMFLIDEDFDALGEIENAYI